MFLVQENSCLLRCKERHWSLGVFLSSYNYRSLTADAPVETRLAGATRVYFLRDFLKLSNLLLLRFQLVFELSRLLPHLYNLQV